MKRIFGAVLPFLTAAFFCGCASRHAGPVYHAGDENPPEFLVGPASLVLTNLNGFSAHVVSTSSTPDGTPQITSGVLLGRDGRLIFQPAMALKGKRARTEGGLFFIWDVTRHSGYVLSEALQAYAPIKPMPAEDGRLNIVKDGIQEEVNGHPCHRCEADVPLKDGLAARLILWQADDARHFPVRIEEVNGQDRMTLNFSEIRLEYPDLALFLPPDGFTRYPSAVSLMNELIVRDASFSRKSQASDLDEPDDTRAGQWHDNQTGVPASHP